MTKLINKIGLKITIVLIVVLIAHSVAFSESALICYAIYSDKPNLLSYVPISNLKGQSQNILQIECPQNISTYTDLNECTAYISNSLNLNIISGILYRLTWEMTGATEAYSQPSGINQIDNYVFNEGTTTVTYTATDNQNNIQTCSFTITVSDNQVPRVIEKPADITINSAYQ